MVLHFQARGHFQDSISICCYGAAIAEERSNNHQRTDDRSKVTCRRCAKVAKIELAPAAPAVSGNTGMCQVCFRDFGLRNGRLNLHGFQRPGDGQLDGQCLGARHLPFQVSCDVTRSVLADTHATIQWHRGDLAAADTVETLEFLNRDTGRYEMARRGTDRFDNLLRYRVRDAQQQIIGLSGMARTMEQKLKNWKKA